MSGSTDTGRVGIHFPGNAGRGRSEHRFRSEQRDEGRRVAFGYPVTVPFAHSADALAYLDSDKLVCLLCGREFTLLSQHLRKTHSMTAREYKTRYNLPIKRGLCGPSLSRLFSVVMRRTMAAGKLGDPSVCAARARSGITWRHIEKGPFAMLRLRESNASPMRRVKATLPFEQRTCECGVRFSAKRWMRKRFCSYECAMRLRPPVPSPYICVRCASPVSKSVWYRQSHRGVAHLCVECGRCP